MARRHVYSYHHVQKTGQIGICGYKAWEGKSVPRDQFESLNQGQRCPDCEAKLAKEALKNLPLSLEKVEQERYSGYKSIYKAIYKGEWVGLIVIPHGWGCAWEVHDINGPGNVFENPAHPGDCVKRHLHSKWAALLAVPALREAGKLHTYAELEAAEKDHQERRKQAEIQREADRKRWAEEKAARDAALAKRRAEIAEALASIAAEFPLSNFQRDALAEVYAQFSSTPLPAKEKAA